MASRRMLRKIDWFLIVLVLIIFILGIVFLYSASRFFSRNFVLRQVIWMGAGLGMMTLVMIVGAHRLLNAGYVIYAVNMILLLLVLVAGTTYAKGAQRWLPIGAGDIGFQPSEFAKISLIIVLAQYLGHRKPDEYGPGTILFSFFLWSVPFLLIVLQPDLGTALALAVILFGILFFWGIKWRHLLTILGAGLILSPLFWRVLKDYQKARLLVFFNPDLGDAYTIIQSRIAVGSGRLFGRGFLEGTQNRLGFLPGRHTDFIFSVAAEEWGFFGALVLILLFFLLLYRCLDIAGATQDRPSRLLGVGIVVMISFHVIVNLGMTTGLLPVVGLPLPWVSYGGSNLLANMTAIGLLLSVRIRRTIF